MVARQNRCPFASWLSLRYLCELSFGFGNFSFLLAARVKFFSFFGQSTAQTSNVLVHNKSFRSASGPSLVPVASESVSKQVSHRSRVGAFLGQVSKILCARKKTKGQQSEGEEISSFSFSKVQDLGRIFSGRKKSWSTFRVGLILIPLAYFFALRLVFDHNSLGSNTAAELSSTQHDESGHLRFRQLEQLNSIGSAGLGDDSLNEEVVINGTNVAIIRRHRKEGRQKAPDETAHVKVPRPRLAQVPRNSKFHAVNWKAKPRLAICLVGAARDFHLTGPSLVTHLLRAYPDGDVFLHSPLDENAHRLSVLQAAAPNVADVRIAPDVPIDESEVTDHVLRWVRSGPEYVTRQQLMQQFKAIEMCVPMITSFERRHRFRYHWVLRTRVDTFWNGPPPPLAALSRAGYTVPAGSDWGGLNDRLGVGRRTVSWKGLRRLSVLRQLAEAGYAGLNAERAYRAQLAHLRVTVTRASFPFCVLSTKKGFSGFPVAAAISSRAALNGAKCRPCVPTVTGEASARYISQLPEKVFGPEVRGVDLCEAEDGWEEGWEAVFDRDAGPEFAAVRQYVTRRSLDECVRDWREFKKNSRVWDAPPPRVLCMRQYLGHFRKVGFPGGDWPVFLEPLTPNSTIYSMGAGDNFSWDYQMMKLYKMTVHSFDSTPEGLRWVAEHIDGVPTAWIHHPWLLGTKDEPMKVYPLDLVDRPFEYSLRLPSNLVLDSVPPSIPVEAKSIPRTMAELGHSRIDLLRIGGHRTLHEALMEKWVRDGKAPPVCQVIISFHKADKHFGSREGRKQLLRLRRVGLELATCIPRGAVPEERIFESCLFFSIHHCPS